MSKALPFIISIIIVTIAACVVAQPAPATKTIAPVSLADVRERGIEGRLGIRLGTIVKVSGTVIAKTSRAKADEGEPFFLRVDRVAGKTLATATVFRSSDMPLVREITSLKVGDQFNCIGYETGGFSGSPAGEFKYVPAYQATGYGFFTRFVVLSAK